MVFSIGLYEALWGHHFLLGECVEHFFSTLARSCQSTSTVLMYKTEEAAAGKRQDVVSLSLSRSLSLSACMCV